MRKRIFEIVQRAQPGDEASRIYDLFIVVVAFLSIAPLMFKETFPALEMLDVVTVYILFLDYILRWFTHDLRTGKTGWKAFLAYPFTPLAIIDLLAILPSLGILPESFRFLRVLRVTKVFRYSKNLTIVANVFASERKTLLSVLIVALMYIFISGLMMFTNEPETFGNFFDALYWATTALTTVGYGDVYPHTELGKGISMVSSLFGIAIIALPAGIITGGFLEQIRRSQEDKVTYFRHAQRGSFKAMPRVGYKNARDYIAARPKGVYYAKMMALCVVLDIGLYHMASFFSLPAWLDTTGTALAAFILEPAAGLLVGYVNNLYLAIIQANAGALLYYVLSAIVALVYGILFARGKKVTGKQLALAVFYLVVVCAALSTLLAYALAGGVPTSAAEQASWGFLQGLGMPALPACFLALLLDRVVDSLAVFALVFALSRFIKRREFATPSTPGVPPTSDDASQPPATKSLVLGISVGTPHTKIALFSAEGKLMGKRSFITREIRTDGSAAKMDVQFEALLIACGCQAQEVSVIGLAVPEAIASADSMRVLLNVDLELRAYRAFLQASFPQAPTHVIDDAEAIVLGEAEKDKAFARIDKSDYALYGAFCHARSQHQEI
ncbi:MAG: ion transporter [Raoultibacter sp.]